VGRLGENETRALDSLGLKLVYIEEGLFVLCRNKNWINLTTWLIDKNGLD